MIEPWDFPASLLPNNSPTQQISEWDLAEELRRQHEAIQSLLQLPLIAEALWYQGRVEAYERDGFDWASVQLGYSFKYLFSENTWDRCTVMAVYGEEGQDPSQLKIFHRGGFTHTQRDISATEFAVRFGGWLEAEQSGA